ncbi:hypothetical protein [Tissierella sp.]|uniref:hypothetical protein n=1 Tax=Tissierella sp. TaxID=41274 RepID=UPI0030347AE5
MIRITGNRGEGAGLLTNLAIEKLLETRSNKICFLIDDTTEFLPLVDKLKGIDVHISEGYTTSTYKEYTEYVEARLNKGNFFRFIISYGFESEIENIERFANELQEKHNVWVFVIYKSAK